MEGADRGADLVDRHVRLQVALGGEAALADLAPVGPLARVSAVVHLQRRLTGQNFVTNDALVRVGELMAERVDQVLELAGLPILVDLNKVFPFFIGIFHLWREHVR